MVYCSGRCSCHWTRAEPVLHSANNLFLQEKRAEKSSPAEIQRRLSFSAGRRATHSKERHFNFGEKNKTLGWSIWWLQIFVIGNRLYYPPEATLSAIWNNNNNSLEIMWGCQHGTVVLKNKCWISLIITTFGHFNEQKLPLTVQQSFIVIERWWGSVLNRWLVIDGDDWWDGENAEDLNQMLSELGWTQPWPWIWRLHVNGVEECRRE